MAINPVWPFKPQPNVWGYPNNPRWTNTPLAPINYDGRESEEPQVWTLNVQSPRSANGSNQHIPCGHWHKKAVEVPEVPFVVPPDDLYILHGAPLSGGTSEQDKCYKRNKDLDTITWYGGSGSGINQLECPWSLCVDADYVYIGDTTNSRLMKRNKLDLTYVTHLAVSDRHTRACHANSDFLYTSESGLIYERDKTTLAIIRTSGEATWESWIDYCLDLTSDDTKLYVADDWGQNIKIFDISTLGYIESFGAISSWSYPPRGLVVTGGCLYLSDTYSNIYKVTPSDYTILTSTYVNSPYGLAADATRLFVCSYKSITVLSLNDLSLITEITTGGVDWPWACTVDANYIYVVDLTTCTVLRYDAITYAFVDESVQTFSSPMGLCIDSNYVYVLDQDADLNIYRLAIADLSYVDKYSDVGWAIFADPQSLYCDGTYLYASDTGIPNTIHRIDKATMAYVDILTCGSTGQPGQIAIDGTDIYVANYVGNAVQRYTLSTMALVSESPLTYGDSNYWMDGPCGITCDENYLYASDDSLEEIKIYDKSTLIFVDKISITGAWRIAVDDTYLYVICTPIATGTTKKFLKTSPYTQVDSVSDQYGMAVDTAYRYQY